MALVSYETNGVVLSKKTLYSGDTVKLTYNGLLAKSGAENIYLHIGFGDDWENKAFIPMQNINGEFCTDINVLEGKKFGVCFKDTAENWDNNSGENYVFKITAKRAKKSLKK